MNKDQITQLQSGFDQITRTLPESEIQFWYARELMPVLGYDRWENFIKAIERAKTSCETAGASPHNHFRDATKMVPIGSGAERPVADLMLTS